ncbi:helix-turn-helix domain-containing protein [Paraburkholderia sp. J41]|uniref:helix-turn-helix domain-containing protein n=1 Tax=Paraburkholderia sp. J41 TaxID=2805433 RepID=UPI002AC318D7|nr:helix-turn-helix domain-containing protein [Paraburkholderia sp. J41]
MARTFFYVNGARDSQVPEQELIRFDRAGYTIALNRVAYDNVPPYVAGLERSALIATLRRVAPGDELVVLDLASLGCSARDVLATLLLCRKAKIAVRCVEFGNTDLAARPEPQAVKMLRALVRLDSSTRSERSTAGLTRARASGRVTGRPLSLTRQQRERVVDLLKQGVSVSELARRFETSRQTIMRVRKSETPSNGRA